jgi:hypothetical protein
MTVGFFKGKDAIMCIGADSATSPEKLKQVEDVDGIIEYGLFNDQCCSVHSHGATRAAYERKSK